MCMFMAYDGFSQTSKRYVVAGAKEFAYDEGQMSPGTFLQGSRPYKTEGIWRKQQASSPKLVLTHQNQAHSYRSFPLSEGKKNRVSNDSPKAILDFVTFFTTTVMTAVLLSATSPASITFAYAETCGLQL